jgi:23S rRNA pseudouridine955/2504/2580 synthase
LHAQLRDGQVEKRYFALVKGAWQHQKQTVDVPLHKYVTPGGERRVAVDEEGAMARTVFRLVRRYGECSLLEAQLKTGRTHQIRVHLAHLGFPIVGDDKYGDFAANRQLAKQGIKRMFLHAALLAFRHPESGERVRITAALPDELSTFLERLEHAADG